MSYTEHIQNFNLQNPTCFTGELWTYSLIILEINGSNYRVSCIMFNAASCIIDTSKFHYPMFVQYVPLIHIRITDDNR